MGECLNHLFSNLKMRDNIGLCIGYVKPSQISYLNKTLEMPIDRILWYSFYQGCLVIKMHGMILEESK